MSELQPVPASLFRKIVWILTIFNVLLVVFYLIGGTLSYFLFEGEVLTSGVLWLVFGVFVGMLNYEMAGQACSTVEAPEHWEDAASGREIGRLVMLVTIGEVLLICAALYLVWWRHIFADGTGFEDLVPILPYFGAIVGVTFLASSASHSKLKGPADS